LGKILLNRKNIFIYPKESAVGAAAGVRPLSSLEKRQTSSVISKGLFINNLLQCFLLWLLSSFAKEESNTYFIQIKINTKQGEK
jgi:hypothetical protein